MQQRHRRSNGSATLIVLVSVLAFVLAFYMVSKSRPIRNLLNVKVVSIDLNSDIEIRPALAKDRLGEIEMFSDMMSRLHPYAAINGTFYDHDDRPMGDILVDGDLVNHGHYRNAIAVTNDGKVEFRRRSRGRFKWAGYRAGLAAGPRLIHNGRIDLDPVADGFSSRSTTLKAWRSGVGTTKKGKLLLVTVKEPITLGEFAHMMLDMGCTEAMNLDGGGACALYHNGRVITTPGLPMTNVLLIYKKNSRR